MADVISRPYALAGEMDTGAKMSLCEHTGGSGRQGKNKYKKEAVDVS